MYTAEFNALLVEFKGRHGTGERPVADIRAAWELMASRFLPTEDLRIAADEAGGVPLEWVEAPGVDPGRVLL